ncbi:MAG: gamma-glutamyltransferase [Hyphomicrobiales bacterium]|nr:gamma-glutamyltransferase [Hyphomicrobiales bacterium]
MIRAPPKDTMHRPPLVLLAIITFLWPAAAGGQGAVEARHGIVLAQEARAARIGIAVLERGGNAIDAAVATGFALAVTYPRAGNIGGGGYMIIHLGERQRGARSIAIDYRESAPAAATRDMFLDEKGNADPRRSRDSALAIGVPGTVAGLAMAHQRFGSGRLTLGELMAPAIALARDGFPVEDDIADSLPRARNRLARWPSSAKIFLRPDGTVLQPGDLLVQRDLADTLAAIAARGPLAFYQGPISERLAAAVQAAGGIMTVDDLRNYRAHIRRPVRGRYRGHEILSMPPSSSGGVVLIQMLNILEGFRLSALDDATRLHLMIEAMRRAYADRAAYLGDPAVVSAPLARLMSKRYAAQLRLGIDPDRATPSGQIRSDIPLPAEGDNTTHFSVVDRYGNAVSNTYTLNFSYGVGLVAEGTGVLLNNELDDFAARPATPNAYGLIGGDANAPGPNKRPLSSMSPTIVLKNGRPAIVTGSPGGSRIITAVLQILVNVIDRNMDAAQAVTAPRIHHQWSPDRVLVEPSLPAAIVTALESRGHKVERRPPATAANTILVTPRGLVGAADPRTRGALAAGY